MVVEAMTGHLLGNWRTSAKKGQLQEQERVMGRISRELQLEEEEK